MMRILLFVVTNIAVLAVLSIVVRLLGLEPYLTESGINYQSLLIFCAVLGMGGSFISLLMSKTMAKRGMGVRVIENPASEQENWLVSTVQRQASEAGIGMPEVGIFDQPVVNAFATGARRDDALVAVSSGLLTAMSRDEAEAVIGHEVTHVANGDMVTLSLIQGVVNTFVMFLSRVVGFFVDRVLLRNERGYGPGFFITTMITQMFLGILATMIVMWFSRWREFRADAGGAALSSRENMINALETLKRVHDQPLPNQLRAFGISGGVGEGLKKLFMSHPPLDERIASLRNSGAG